MLVAETAGMPEVFSVEADLARMPIGEITSVVGLLTSYARDHPDSGLQIGTLPINDVPTEGMFLWNWQQPKPQHVAQREWGDAGRFGGYFVTPSDIHYYRGQRGRVDHIEPVRGATEGPQDVATAIERVEACLGKVVANRGLAYHLRAAS